MQKRMQWKSPYLQLCRGNRPQWESGTHELSMNLDQARPSSDILTRPRTVFKVCMLLGWQRKPWEKDQQSLNQRESLWFESIFLSSSGYFSFLLFFKHRKICDLPAQPPLEWVYMCEWPCLALLLGFSWSITWTWKLGFRLPWICFWGQTRELGK